MSKTQRIMLAIIPIIAIGSLAASLFIFMPRKTAGYEEKMAACRSIPNGSTMTVTETSRKFINLPKDVYPDRDALFVGTVKGNATAGWISNGGPYGEAMDAAPGCWSYYYEFDGQGTVEVRAKSAVNGMPDYAVRFIVE